MTQLMCRLVDLREEYFTGMTNEELSEVHALLGASDKIVYTSDELIEFMGNYYDKK